MATFLAKILIREGKEAAFEETARMMYEATHTHEPNCRRYEYWRGAQPRFYYCMESFTDYISFMEHQMSDHHEAPDFGSMIEAIELEWVDPIVGAAPLEPTVQQDLPADASDFMRSKAKGHPLIVQEWWKALGLL